MKFDAYVERKLWLVDTNTDNRIDIKIEIGRPIWSEPEIQAICPVFNRGLMNEPLNIFGSDLFSALKCGLDFVAAELENLPSDQAMQSPSGESYFE